MSQERGGIFQDSDRPCICFFPLELFMQKSGPPPPIAHLHAPGNPDSAKKEEPDKTYQPDQSARTAAAWPQTLWACRSDVWNMILICVTKAQDVFCVCLYCLSVCRMVGGCCQSSVISVGMKNTQQGHETVSGAAICHIMSHLHAADGKKNPPRWCI